MKYEFIDTIQPDTSHGKILHQVKPGSLVLECGCAGGYMTKYLKEELNCTVYIVEYDHDAFDSAMRFAEDGFCGDLNDSLWAEKYASMKFDYILFSDVLEHLSSPHATLKQAIQLMKDDGTLLVSLPNIGHNDILIKLWAGHWDYTPIGLLDNTHIHFWGVNNLDSFFLDLGLKITIKDYTSAPTMHTEQFSDASIPVNAQILDTLAHRLYGEIYQFILTLQKESYVLSENIPVVDLLPSGSESSLDISSLLMTIHQHNIALQDKERHIRNLEAMLKSQTQLTHDILESKDQHIRNLEAQMQSVQELRNVISALSAQINTAEQTLCTLRESENRLTRELKYSQQELDYYKPHYQTAAKQCDELTLQLQHYTTLFNSVIASKSWKITAPLRFVMAGIKKLVRSNRFTHLLAKGVKSLFRDGISITWKRVKLKLKSRQNRKNAKIQPYTQEDLERQKNTQFPKKIVFSILVPLYNTPPKFLKEMIQSVQNQTYANWELCLADGSDEEHSNVGRICKDYAGKDSRIRYQKLEKNLGISGNTNACIDMATGDYLSLFDHDDLLHPAALYAKMKAICEQDADFIYTDENTFHNTPADAFCPHFKPDYAPDTLRANNYICHFTSFSRELLDSVGKFRSECDGSQDFDMVLRLTEKAKKIVHIPQILYYWRAHSNSVAETIGAKPYVIEAAKRAVRDHLERVGLKGDVLDSTVPSMYRLRYEIEGSPLVSILIPNYEHKAELQVCLESIFRLTTYPNFEIIVIENNSRSQEIFDYYKQIQDRWDNVKVITWTSHFNYSAINNFGAKYASGEHLLLLNNDTEIITPDWIQEMLMYSQRTDVGAVGAKLYYPDDTIQHAGLGLGLLTLAGHLHRNFPRNHPGYMGRLSYAQNLSGVTAACVMIRRDVWNQVSGLDESFEVAFNDVDLCMRIRKAGYLIVWTPFAELYHYESKSRGSDDTTEKRKRFLGEVERFQKRWAKELEAGDPYYNPNFSLDSEDFSIR